jgi:hypothetical protein
MTKEDFCKRMRISEMEFCIKRNGDFEIEDMEQAYNFGKEDEKHDLMMKLKDEGIVKPLKDSILRNERLSSQEQQELCAWIECAMEFGENLDECAKENADLGKELTKRAKQIEALNKDKDYFSDALDKQIEATYKVVEENNELKAQIEKMKSDVKANIKWADKNKNNQMYFKLNAMFNQWELRR